jgi:hypothetical protein
MADEPSNINELLGELIDSRIQFFARCLNGIPHLQRGPLAQHFLTVEETYLQIIDRLQRAQTRSNIVANIITWAAVNPNLAMEPVTVVATPQQISSSVQVIPTSTSICAICQESVNTDCVKITQCGHEYHGQCLTNWFTMSVRCPVCRHDIRQPSPTGHPNQTSSVLG